MKRFLAMAMATAALAAGAQTKLGDVVMVTAGGELAPSGAVASVTQLSTLAAQAQANATAAALLAQGMAETEAKCEAFEAMLQAREGTIWIESFNVWRIGEKESVNADITAEIVKFEPHYAESGTNWLNRIFTFFNEDPGYTPYVRVGRSPGATNEWGAAPVTSTYLTNLVIGSTSYQYLTVSEFATPKAWSNAFFRVGSQVRGWGTNELHFPVNNGVQVKGEEPLTLVATLGTNKIRIVGGVVCVPK